MNSLSLETVAPPETLCQDSAWRSLVNDALKLQPYSQCNCSGGDYIYPKSASTGKRHRIRRSHSSAFCARAHEPKMLSNAIKYSLHYIGEFPNQRSGTRSKTREAWKKRFERLGINADVGFLSHRDRLLIFSSVPYEGLTYHSFEELRFAVHWCAQPIGKSTRWQMSQFPSSLRSKEAITESATQLDGEDPAWNMTDRPHSYPPEHGSEVYATHPLTEAEDPEDQNAEEQLSMLIPEAKELLKELAKAWESQVEIPEAQWYSFMKKAEAILGQKGAKVLRDDPDLFKSLSDERGEHSEAFACLLEKLRQYPHFRSLIREKAFLALLTGGKVA